MANLVYAVNINSRPEAINRFFRLVIYANYGANPKCRIYLDGTSPPAYTNMTNVGGGQRIYEKANIAEGLYVIDYKDDTQEFTVMKGYIWDSITDSCYDEFDEGLFQTTISRTDLEIKVTHFAGAWFGHTSTEIQSVSQREISIDGGVTWKPGVYFDSSSSARASWTPDELDGLDIGDPIPDVRVRRLSNACVDTTATLVKTFNEVPLEPLTADYTDSDCTANGANDGEIVVTVDGGSGNYEFLWADGPTTQNRVGLSPGVYAVLITDVETEEEVELSNIQITEPAVVPVQEFGTKLEIPPLNSLFFIVDPIEPDNIETFQGLDNVMFCKRHYGEFEEGDYKQKVCIVDIRPIQFNSDFQNHEAVILAADGETVLQVFPVELVEQNIGRTVDFPISIQYDSVGKARVYFAAGDPPISLEVGDPFEILNNLDGFNGSYLITDIVFDSLVGYAYLVINLNYDAPGSSSVALGRFAQSLTDYNVFEVVFSFALLEEGIYQCRIRAFDLEGGGEKIGFSEPIDLREVHPETVLVEYRNFDNKFNMVWSLGYIGRKRVEGYIGHRRNVGGERSTTRDASYNMIKTAAKKTRGPVFEVTGIPDYLYEILCVIVDLDFFAVNKIECQTSEGFGAPTVQDKSLLVDAVCNVEQIGWFREYNSDDIGTIAEDSLIVDENDSFIKST